MSRKKSITRGLEKKKSYLNQITHNSPQPLLQNWIWYKIYRGGFIDRECKGVGVGKEENRLLFSFSRSALEKNWKK